MIDTNEDGRPTFEWMIDKCGDNIGLLKIMATAMGKEIRKLREENSQLREENALLKIEITL